MSVDDVIRDVTNKSDIAIGSDVYAEITRELTGIGLNLAFFVFTTSEHSSAARTLDGKTATHPILTVYLKYDVDFQQTGIDPHHGNWGDKWAQTRTVRDALNAVLQRHGFDNGYVSDHAFIFVYTLEELVFREIGRECKNAVQEFICDEVPGVVVSRVFWNGQQYDVIMGNKTDYKRIKRNVKVKASKALPRILAAADIDAHCQSYKAVIEFGYSGMNLFHLTREDI